MKKAYLLLYISISSLYMLSCSTNMEKKPKIDPIVNLNLSANIMPDITYHVVDGHEIKLDVIAPRIYLGEDPWYKYEGKKSFKIGDILDGKLNGMGSLKFN